MGYDIFEGRSSFVFDLVARPLLATTTSTYFGRPKHIDRPRSRVGRPILYCCVIACGYAAGRLNVSPGIAQALHIEGLDHFFFLLRRLDVVLQSCRVVEW